jgi:hypothetical protein
MLQVSSTKVRFQREIWSDVNINISNCVFLIGNCWDSHCTHESRSPRLRVMYEVSKNIEKLEGIISRASALLKPNAFMGLKMPHTEITFILTILGSIQYSCPRLSSFHVFFLLSSVLFISLPLWRLQRTTEMPLEYLICYSLLERPLNPFIIHIFNVKLLLKLLYKLQFRSLGWSDWIFLWNIYVVEW